MILSQGLYQFKKRRLLKRGQTKLFGWFFLSSMHFCVIFIAYVYFSSGSSINSDVFHSF